MCTKNCLCNSCNKKKTCSDCPFIDKQDIENTPWSVICSTTGIKSCDYYIKPIKPPEINHEIKEDNQTIIKFKNGSSIETISGCENKRSSRARIYELIDLSEYHWWQRLYLRFLDSDLVRRMNKYKRR